MPTLMCGNIGDSDVCKPTTAKWRELPKHKFADFDKINATARYYSLTSITNMTSRFAITLRWLSAIPLSIVSTTFSRKVDVQARQFTRRCEICFAGTAIPPADNRTRAS